MLTKELSGGFWEMLSTSGRSSGGTDAMSEAQSSDSRSLAGFSSDEDAVRTHLPTLRALQFRSPFRVEASTLIGSRLVRRLLGMAVVVALSPVALMAQQQLWVSKAQLNFGAKVGGTPATSTQYESVVVTGAPSWAVKSDKTWLKVTPDSGLGAGKFSVSVDAAGLGVSRLRLRT